MSRVVIIDSNESAVCPRIKELLSHRFEISVQPLKSGDYILAKEGRMRGSIGIERKAIPDLISSIMDGRLYKQVGTLCDTYEYPVLLIEGSLYPFISNPVLMGAYVTLQYSYKKLKIAHSRDMKGTVAFIKRSAIYLGPTGRKPPLVKEKKSTPSEIRLAMLQTISGVGPKLSRSLIRQLPALFYSHRGEKKELIDKLSKVKGISKQKAAKIASVFTEYGEVEEKE